MDLLKAPEALKKPTYFWVDTSTEGEIVICITTYNIYIYIQNMFWGHLEAFLNVFFV